MWEALSNATQLLKLVKTELEKFINVFTKEKQLIKGDTQVAYRHRSVEVATQEVEAGVCDLL